MGKKYTFNHKEDPEPPQKKNKKLGKISGADNYELDLGEEDKNIKDCNGKISTPKIELNGSSIEDSPTHAEPAEVGSEVAGPQKQVEDGTEDGQKLEQVRIEIASPESSCSSKKEGTSQRSSCSSQKDARSETTADSPAGSSTASNPTEKSSVGSTKGGVSKIGYSNPAYEDSPPAYTVDTPQDGDLSKGLVLLQGVPNTLKLPLGAILPDESVISVSGDEDEHDGEVSLLYSRHEKIPMKDFAAEIRASLDVENFLNSAILLLDLAEASIDAILDRMLRPLIVDNDEPNVTLAEAKRAIFTHDSVHKLAKTIQGTCCTYSGAFDYDQSWVCILCTMPSLQKRHVAIARLRSPANLGRTSQEVYFIILVVAPTKKKKVPTATLR